MQNGQDGMTALEMARNKDTVQCFVDHGIKLSDIVTDEVVIACVSASDGPMLYVCVGERDRGRESIWHVGVRVRTRVSEETHVVATGIRIRAIKSTTGVMGALRMMMQAGA